MRELDNRLMRHIDLLVERYASLESARNDIVAAYLLLEESYENGGKLLVAGNGGSAADAEHIVGELMKGFKLPRKPEADFAEKLVEENQELGSVLAENLQGALPAIALDGHPALSTAYMNDCEPLLCFAQQVNGYGKSGDVFLGISTSGNSKNVLYAATTAHAKGMKVICFAGFFCAFSLSALSCARIEGFRFGFASFPFSLSALTALARSTREICSPALTFASSSSTVGVGDSLLMIPSIIFSFCSVVCSVAFR